MPVFPHPFFRWLFAALFCIAVWPSVASSQSSATLRVIVLSTDDGNPVPGANVVLRVLEGDTLRTGATNRDGFREFTGLSPGDYELTVSFIGYETYREALSLEPGRHVRRVDLAVRPEELEEVYVEGMRGAARRLAGLQTVTSRDLQRIPTPGPGGDLATYLQTMPGVVSGGDRGGELFIRGGTPAQNLVLVDELRVIKPFHISNLFSAFPDEVVQRVEMYAGGFGAEYMGATSSVVDVTLRPGHMRSYQGSVSASPYMVSLHAEGPLEIDRQSFLAMARYSTINETAGAITTEELPIRFYDLTARYSLQQYNLSCTFTGLHTYDRGQINPERDVRLSWSNTVAGGRCLLFGRRFAGAYNLSLGYSRFQNSEGTLDEVQRSAGVQMLYGQVDSGQEIQGHPLNYGASWTIAYYSADIGGRFRAVHTFGEYVANYRAFVSLEWQPSDRLTLMPSFGLQIASERIGSPALEPRLRLTFRPFGTPRQEVSLAFGRYHQLAERITDERDAGTTFSYWTPSEDDDPLPRADHAILGYRHSLGRFAEVSLEGYAMLHANIPVSRWEPEFDPTIETALADGTVYGTDVRLELDREPFYFLLGYGWSKVTYEAASDDLGSWLRETIFRYSPAHDLRHQFHSLISYEYGKFTASARWEYGSGLPYTKIFGYDTELNLPREDPATDRGNPRILFHRPYDGRMPPYHRLDVSIGRSFDLSAASTLDLEVGAINAYDRRNVFYYDVNTLHRVDEMPVVPYVSLRASID